MTAESGSTSSPKSDYSQKILVVTGHVPRAFPSRHLSFEQFRGLGDQLKLAAEGRILVFDGDRAVEDLWAHRLLVANPDLMPADPDPPADRFDGPADAVTSNIVCHERFEWVRRAAELHPDIDVFVWIDYSVFKQPGVTAEVIRDYLDAIERTPVDSVTAPGVWPKVAIDDSRPHWRFVASTWMCPRELVVPLSDLANLVLEVRATHTGKITWDANTLSYVELLDVLPFRWYPGDHNETQFRGFSELAN
ncbi:MAG: hypothetical protein F2947_08155 [Actinobacteria bacterium]|uniref:Unannotated protein n=1 Tax=freshwater metagenome TaxID=449393 RepID=A0A6J7NHS0_9ZZZZ|nr:hypothetical protein [Actinomycetota bacterium]MSW31632.1 hypothetical protein [Actinomycetota bacterium]MTA45277.1 hypothetical protein [Actinomycetota bacterium]MTB23236.1 hypothetical protein [Actinomycetota bacterium]